ncbi:MAG: response regulator [Microcoleus sp. CAN_BIN18]|nr:response regulator [Microcoleus sp. CAN_BIN18]
MLLVDDVEVNQMVAAQILRKLGNTPDFASSGKAALDAFERSEYDIVFMDMQMPEMDGLETTRLIRQRFSGDFSLASDEQSYNLKSQIENSKSTFPWIIAMTANAMQGDRELCLEAGMNDYISKPVRVQAIVQAIALYDRETGHSKFNPKLNNPQVEPTDSSSQAQPVGNEIKNVAPAIDETAFEELKHLITRAGVLISQIESGNQSESVRSSLNSGEILAVTKNIQFPTLPTGNNPNLEADKFKISRQNALPQAVKSIIKVPPLDSQTFEELRELLGEEAEEFWIELVEKFLEVVPPKLQEIVDAVNQADAPAIKASAHALRGACTTVGAMPLFQLCTQLEQMARNETLADSDILMCKIAAEYQRVKVALLSEVLNDRKRLPGLANKCIMTEL